MVEYLPLRGDLAVGHQARPHLNPLPVGEGLLRALRQYKEIRIGCSQWLKNIPRSAGLGGGAAEAVGDAGPFG